MKVTIDRIMVRGLRGRPDPGSFAAELTRELSRSLDGAEGATGRDVEVVKVELRGGLTPAASIAEALGRVVGGKP